MHYSSQLLVLASALDIVQSTALPQITQAPNPLEKRDDSKVTLNIGPITKYQQTTVSLNPRPALNSTRLMCDRLV